MRLSALPLTVQCWDHLDKEEGSTIASGAYLIFSYYSTFFTVNRLIFHSKFSFFDADDHDSKVFIGAVLFTLFLFFCCKFCLPLHCYIYPLLA